MQYGWLVQVQCGGQFIDQFGCWGLVVGGFEGLVDLFIVGWFGQVVGIGEVWYQCVQFFVQLWVVFGGDLGVGV